MIFAYVSKVMPTFGVSFHKYVLLKYLKGVGAINFSNKSNRFCFKD